MTSKERLLSGQPFIILNGKQESVLVLEQTSMVSINRIRHYTDRTKLYSTCEFYNADTLELRFGDYEFPTYKTYIPIYSIIFLDLPKQP